MPRSNGKTPKSPVEAIFSGSFRPKVFALQKTRQFDEYCEHTLELSVALKNELIEAGCSHLELNTTLHDASQVVISYLGDVKNHVAETNRLSQLLADLFTGSGPYSRLLSAQPANAAHTRSRFWAALYIAHQQDPDGMSPFTEALNDAIGWMVIGSKNNLEKLSAEINLYDQNGSFSRYAKNLGTNAHSFLNSLTRISALQSNGGLGLLLDLGADIQLCAEAVQKEVLKTKAGHKSLPLLYSLSEELNSYLDGDDLICSDQIKEGRVALLNATLSAAGKKTSRQYPGWNNLVTPLVDHLSEKTRPDLLARFALVAGESLDPIKIKWLAKEIGEQKIYDAMSGAFDASEQTMVIKRLGMEDAIGMDLMMSIQGERLSIELGL